LRICLEDKIMKIADIEPILAPDMRKAFRSAAKRSLRHNGILTEQDILISVAIGPLADAFGSRSSLIGVINGLDESANFTARFAKEGLLPLEDSPFKSSVQMTREAWQLIKDGKMRARELGRTRTHAIDVLEVALGENGQQPIDPLTLLGGEGLNPSFYRRGIMHAARAIAAHQSEHYKRRAVHEVPRTQGVVPVKIAS
jgi:hypothetical protein